MEELLKGVPPNVAIKNISDQQAGALAPHIYILNNTEAQIDTIIKVCQLCDTAVTVLAVAHEESVQP